MIRLDKPSAPGIERFLPGKSGDESWTMDLSGAR